MPLVNASIPLSIKAPEIQSPIEAAGKVLQLRDLMQQTQVRGLEIQKAQREQEDDKAIREAYALGIGADGSVDRNTVTQYLSKNGNPNALMKIQKAWLDEDNAKAKSRMELSDALLRMEKGQREQFQFRVEALAKATADIDALPLEQRAQAWDESIDSLAQMGLDFSAYKGKFDPAMAKNIRREAMEIKDVLASQDWSNPISATDEAGNPVLIHSQGKTGEYVPVKGFKPPPKGAGSINFGLGNDVEDASVDMLAQNWLTSGRAPVGLYRVPNLYSRVVNRMGSLSKEMGLGTDLSEAERVNKNKTLAYEYWTKGKGADAVRQQNTIMEHAGQFLQAVDAMDRGDLKAANRITSRIGLQLGEDKVSNLQVIAHFLSEETGKYLAAGTSSAEERQKLEEIIDTMSGSPAQLKGAIKTLHGLVASQQKSWKRLYEQGMQGQPVKFGLDQKPSKDAPLARPLPKKGDVVDGYEFLGGDPNQPTSWQKK